MKKVRNSLTWFSHGSGAASALVPLGRVSLTQSRAKSALECQQVCTPFERTAVVDSDLLAVAQKACKWISELVRRWQPVTDFIRQFQLEEVPLVTTSRHIAFIDLLLLLIQYNLMFDLIFGFPAVGFAPHCLFMPAKKPHSFLPKRFSLLHGTMLSTFSRPLNLAHLMKPSLKQ